MYDFCGKRLKKLDNLDRLIHTKNLDGGHERLMRDGEGNVLKRVHPNAYDSCRDDGEGTTYDYDSDGNNIRIHYLDGGCERIFYDGEGNRIRHVMPESYDPQTDDGEGFTYTYDACSRLTGVTGPDGVRQASYTYDPAGNLTEETDAEGRCTYRYNSQGKVCEITDQEGNRETFRYDREGRMVLHVDRNGSEVRTTYNVDGNPVLETGTDRNGENRVTRSFEYDASGNVRKAVAGGFCYTYKYRPDGKLLKKSASGRTLVSSTYFSDGSLESLTDASGKPVFYEYDWRGNLSAVKDGNGETLAAYAHTPGGRLKEIRHGNGLCTRYEYDTDGNMIHLHFQRENGETISDLWYEYDLNGNRTLKTGKCILSGESLTDLAVSYRYDSMDRLTSESRDGEETAYSYDFCGNRLKKLDKNGTEEYHYNRKNQLICRFSEKEKTAYRYDLQGNLLEAAGAEGTAVFSYNAFHQQTAMTMPDGKHLENRYDAEYLRAGTVENGTVTTFSYHNGELLAESSPEGDTISRYIPGYGVAAGWNREKSGYHYYHLDEQNSTAYITGSSGEIKNRYEYDAFGVLQNSREELPNRILYTGQQYDQTSGQYYLRARFYNPVIGRFVQEDVYRGDGLNLYAYCKNNPVVYYDPSGYGEEKCDKVGGNDSKSGSNTTATERRNSPGVVEGNGRNTSKMMYGTDKNAGVIPKEIADKLREKQYNNFDEFRNDFWKAVAETDYANEFLINGDPKNYYRMKNGGAPLVVSNQAINGSFTYQLHHIIPINQGGSVYSVDNLVVVTPRYHAEILIPEVHGYNGFKQFFR